MDVGNERNMVEKPPQEIDWFQFYGLMKGRNNNLINHAASRDNWKKNTAVELLLVLEYF